MPHCAPAPVAADWWPPLPSILIGPPRAIGAQYQRLRDTLDTIEVSHQVRSWAKYGAATLAGAAVAGAAGYVALHAAVPALVAVSQQAMGISEMLYAVPGAGLLLRQAIGNGGVFGAVTTSACWLGVINTLMLSEGRAETLTYWVLAHVAIGAALAPVWVPGVAAGTPVLAVATAAALLTSYTLTGRLLSGQSTWQGTIMGTVGALAVGPIGPRLALGGSANAAIGTALMLGAVGATMVGAFMLMYGWPTLTTDETAVLNRTRVDTTEALHLDMPGELNPGVFGLPTGLVQEVKACALNLREKMPLGLRCYLLSGAPGTGKTLMAEGIARRLGAEMFAPRATAIKARVSPAASVMQLFEEARIKGRKTGKPVVMFFDEAERLFENRAALQHGGAVDRTSHDLVLAFNEELDGVHRHAGLNMIVIAATNHESALDPSIRSRFFVRETLHAPQTDAIGKIFETQLSTLQKTEAISRFGALQFESAAVARWAARIKDSKLAGRDIKTVVTAALRQVSAAYVDAHAAPGSAGHHGRGSLPAWDEGSARLERAVDAQLDKLISNNARAQAEAAMFDAPPAAAPAPAPVGRVA